MGFFNFIGQTVTAAGKAFKHIAKSFTKGLSDPYRFVKNTANAASGISRPLTKGVHLLNKGLAFARKIPVVGKAIDAADLAVFSATGVSPVRGLILIEEGLKLFNKIEGRLQQANSAEEFLSQNKEDLKKLLKSPALREKILGLLKKLV